MGNNNMGKLAIVFKEKWNRFSHYLRNILQNDIACLCITPSLCRRLIYNWLGHNVKGVVFPHCFLGVAKGKLTLGQNSFINYSCFLDLSNDIIIGDGVSIAFKTIVALYDFMLEFGNLFFSTSVWSLTLMSPRIITSAPVSVKSS